MVKDVKEFYYCIVEPEHLKTYLGAEFNQWQFNNLGQSEKYTYEMIHDAIYTFVSQSFIEGGNGEGGMHTDSEETSLSFDGKDAKVAACIAHGEDAGIPVYELFTLVCHNGKSKTLEEAFGIQ